MSARRPPGDDGPPSDSVVDEVVDQVQRALDEAQLSLGPARDQLAAELRAAFRMVGKDLLGRAPASEPSLSVVVGGREEDAPRAAAPDPGLRVAAPPAEADPAPAAPLTPGLRWVMRKPLAGAGVPGKLRLDPPTDGDDGWQTLFRGSAPRAYRIHCDTGTLEVAIDGLPGERVRAGCSMDLEARLVRVRARPGAPVSARYRRIATDGDR